MESTDCQVEGKAIVGDVAGEGRKKWADLIDGPEDIGEMDMSSLSKAIEGCEVKGKSVEAVEVVSDGVKGRESRAIEVVADKVRQGRDHVPLSEKTTSSPFNSKHALKASGEKDVDDCSETIKNSNDDDCKNAEADEDTDMMKSHGVAGKTPKRRQLHHIGDGVTSLCKTIQFVKVGTLPPPIKYRHRLQRDTKGKSDPNRWLKEALMDVDSPSSSTAGRAVHVIDRRMESPLSTAREPREISSASPWHRRRESLSRGPPDPPRRLSLLDRGDRGSSSHHRERSPPSSYTQPSPFASLDRRRPHRESQPSDADPLYFPHHRETNRPSDFLYDDAEEEEAFMTSPLPPPNFDIFYRRQKELQREKEAMLTHDAYDAPPHLRRHHHLYTNTHPDQQQRIIHDPSLAVHPHRSAAPLSFSSRNTYLEREPHPPHPDSVSFSRRREQSRPGRLPPNGEPYWIDPYDAIAESSSPGVRRDDVVHARPYSSTSTPQSENLRGDIDLLKRGILNRTMRD